MAAVRTVHSPLVCRVASWFNNLLIAKGEPRFEVAALAFPIPWYGTLIFHRDWVLDDVVLNHELIHCAQQQELGYLGWAHVCLQDIWISHHQYNSGWYQNYMNMRFEQEAYGHELDASYLENRVPMAWQNYSLDPQDLQTEEV